MREGQVETINTGVCVPRYASKVRATDVIVQALHQGTLSTHVLYQPCIRFMYRETYRQNMREIYITMQVCLPLHCDSFCSSVINSWGSFKFDLLKRLVVCALICSLCMCFNGTINSLKIQRYTRLLRYNSFIYMAM